MSKKRYQIFPIELVQWAEPLFGYGERWIYVNTLDKKSRKIMLLF